MTGLEREMLAYVKRATIALEKIAEVAQAAQSAELDVWDDPDRKPDFMDDV